MYQNRRNFPTPLIVKMPNDDIMKIFLLFSNHAFARYRLLQLCQKYTLLNPTKPAQLTTKTVR